MTASARGLDGQALDGVDAVQLSPAGGHFGQVPAGRRGRAADPPRAVQYPPPFQDASDGADRGQRHRATLEQRGEDGLGADVPQVAPLAQLPSQVHDQVLDRFGRAPCGAGDGWPVLPVDPVEAPALGVLDPVVDGRLTDAEAPGDLVLGRATADGFDDVTTLLCRQAPLLIATSRRRAVSVQVTSSQAVGPLEARRHTIVSDSQVVSATR